MRLLCAGHVQQRTAGGPGQNVRPGGTWLWRPGLSRQAGAAVSPPSSLLVIAPRLLFSMQVHVLPKPRER